MTRHVFYFAAQRDGRVRVAIAGAGSVGGGQRVMRFLLDPRVYHPGLPRPDDEEPIVLGAATILCELVKGFGGVAFTGADPDWIDRELELAREERAQGAAGRYTADAPGQRRRRR